MAVEGKWAHQIESEWSLEKEGRFSRKKGGGGALIRRERSHCTDSEDWRWGFERLIYLIYQSTLKVRRPVKKWLGGEARTVCGLSKGKRSFYACIPHIAIGQEKIIEKKGYAQSGGWMEYDHKTEATRKLQNLSYLLED